MKTILVSYATRAGSTAEIAGEIHRVLKNSGLDVELSPMDKISTISQYGAVIAGSAIRMDRWLPEALGFLERFRKDLLFLPFAAFSVCLALATKNGSERESSIRDKYLRQVRTLVPSISSGEVFAGVLDLSKLSMKLRLPFSFLTSTTFFKEGDYRDWDVIHRWAEDLPSILIPGASSK